GRGTCNGRPGADAGRQLAGAGRDGTRRGRGRRGGHRRDFIRRGLGLGERGGNCRARGALWFPRRNGLGAIGLGAIDLGAVDAAWRRRFVAIVVLVFFLFLTRIKQSREQVAFRLFADIHAGIASAGQRTGRRIAAALLEISQRDRVAGERTSIGGDVDGAAVR